MAVKKPRTIDAVIDSAIAEYLNSEREQTVEFPPSIGIISLPHLKTRFNAELNLALQEAPTIEWVRVGGRGGETYATSRSLRGYSENADPLGFVLHSELSRFERHSLDSVLCIGKKQKQPVSSHPQRAAFLYSHQDGLFRVMVSPPASKAKNKQANPSSSPSSSPVQEVDLPAAFSTLADRFVVQKESHVMPKAALLLPAQYMARVLPSPLARELLHQVGWAWVKPKGFQGLYVVTNALRDYAKGEDTSPLVQAVRSHLLDTGYELRLERVVRQYRAEHSVLPGYRTPIFYFSGDRLRPLVSAANQRATVSSASPTNGEEAVQSQRNGGYVRVQTFLHRATVPGGGRLPPARHADFLAAIQKQYNIVPVRPYKNDQDEYFSMSDVEQLERVGIRQSLAEEGDSFLGRQSSVPHADMARSFGRRGAE